MNNVSRSVRDNPGAYRSFTGLQSLLWRQVNGGISPGLPFECHRLRFLGIVIFVVAFALIDKMTPYDLWKEIVEEKNMALAMLVGAMSIGDVHHHRRGSALKPVSIAVLFLSVFLIAACGLIYELIAGTLASYLLGDSVFSSPPSSAATCSPWASAASSRASSAAAWWRGSSTSS